MAEAQANEFLTTLAAAIDADDDELTLSIAPPASLVGGNFRLRIGAGGDNQNHEYVLVGSVVGAVLSGVARGEEDTTARPWNAGTRVAQVLTVAGLATLTTGDSFFVHDQSVASALWTVIHNLGKRPSVTVVDTTGRVVFGQIDFIDANSLAVSFSSPFSGKVYLN